MHPINRFFGMFNMQLRRLPRRIPGDFKRAFEVNYASLKNNERGFDLFREMYYEVGAHPMSFVDFECGFTARHLSNAKATEVVDIGSYRVFVLGLLAGFKVTALDVRSREAEHPNEVVIVGDAKSLPLPSNSVKVLTSLCALEHFGLGRYGDEFDPDGDIRAVKEMVRVLTPGGTLILSTTITRTRPAIAYNAHRIYSREMLRKLFSELHLEDESFYSTEMKKTVPYEEVTTTPKVWDIYIGKFRK